MILLDTHVVSEPLKPHGEPAVMAWIDAQAVETLYLSAITLAERRFGIAAMQDGKPCGWYHGCKSRRKGLLVEMRALAAAGADRSSLAWRYGCHVALRRGEEYKIVSHHRGSDFGL